MAIHMYTIRVTYPTILKMTLSSDHQVPSGTSLAEIKKEIFQKVWGQLREHYPTIVEHGKPEDVILLGDNTILLTDADLEESAKAGKLFTAVFGQAVRGVSGGRS